MTREIENAREMLNELRTKRSELEMVIGTLGVELIERAVATHLDAQAPKGRVALILETSIPVAKALAKLVATGMFGQTPAEAAEQLLRERLRQDEIAVHWDLDGVEP